MLNIYGSKFTELLELPTTLKTVIETQEQMRRELAVQQETISRLKWKINQQNTNKSRQDVVKEVCEERKKRGKEMKKTGNYRVVAGLAPRPGTLPAHLAAPKMFYNWKGKKTRKPLKKETVVSYLHGMG